MTTKPKLQLSEATLGDRARRAARQKAAPLMSVHSSDVLSLLKTRTFVVRLSTEPCECGHVDKRRCWEHARDWARDNWCHPCEADFLLRHGRLP